MSPLATLTRPAAPPPILPEPASDAPARLLGPVAEYQSLAACLPQTAVLAEASRLQADLHRTEDRILDAIEAT